MKYAALSMTIISKSIPGTHLMRCQYCWATFTDGSGCGCGANRPETAKADHK